MATQTDIVARIEPIVPRDREVRMVDLRRLYESDQNALFELALYSLSSSATIAQLGLQRLARVLSILMRDGFAVETIANQHYARGRRGGIMPLDDGQPDVEFLQHLYAGSGYSSKMDSQKRSRECLDFFLEEHKWDESIRKMQLLRVAPEDAHAILNGLPKYQHASLLDCAREVVRSPSVVYKGLRHDGPMREGGFAFCGIPSRRHMNTPEAAGPPPGMVFIVFANHDGYVFDWDWAPADSTNPSRPRNAAERFPHGVVTDACGELLLGNVRGKQPQPFHPSSAWYSPQGDCVLWYHSDTESYADSYDNYLTAFFDATNLDPNRQRKDACVGFKLKMVSRLFDTIERWAEPGTGEGIALTFDADKVEIELLFLMKAWQNAALPTTKELSPGMRLMEQLGESGRSALDGENKLQIPRQSLDKLRQMQSA